jgi:hypothetical protein
MIARNVNQHIPEKQFDHKCFQNYKTDTSEHYMDLDALIKTKDLL